MQEKPNKKHRWGVILAGGDGTRLRSLTRLVSDDERPKQFCPLLGGKTLLAQTRLRIAGSIDSGQTLFSLTESHKPFYAAELAKVPSACLVAQPSNRGTLPAILWSLLRIVRLDEDAVVAFFPSDHYYSDEGKFVANIESAFDFAGVDARSVILLGAVAKNPEVEYGWIEAETVSANGFDGLKRVKRFWEKPSDQLARALFDRGCLWNTFVMVGRAGAFLEMTRQAVPSLYRNFVPVLRLTNPDNEGEAMQPVYNSLSTGDFSREVLSVSTERLAVASFGDIGWSDLGTPRRLITTLFESGIESPWVGASGCCNQCGLTLTAS